MSEEKKQPVLVQFGAGNIGRSFIAQLFSQAGYRVIFADVDASLIAALNERGSYEVVIKEDGIADRRIPVRHVSGVLASDREALRACLGEADILATAVGMRALEPVCRSIADGLRQRLACGNARPVDIILAENVADAADRAAGILRAELGEDFPDASFPGLVESSIGKMVPIMSAEDKAADPLQVFAEAYNNLIVDAHGFRSPVPAVPGLSAKNDMRAWVDRKLYIHNLGHAAAAYLGHRRFPQATYVYEVLTDADIFAATQKAMRESAAALLQQHPGSFSQADLEAHIKDLLHRFQNRALGDTVFRVGRDLARKLSWDDRLFGAARLCQQHGLPWEGIAEAIRAGQVFKAADEHGDMDPGDLAFHDTITHAGLAAWLRDTGGMNGDPQGPVLLEMI